ncbi:hypothetical protein XENTR_v10011084 [Xenopus tropicalis]|uniref:D(4) dopamine receptor n=1 Tax=Xenopus tropicalis TaxID=8364 RepID=A0A6I8PX99_XENTR|eukprot:XP_012817827.1 PREDICTED: D(4) dopamine receptor [Xenopus tropicalis]
MKSPLEEQLASRDNTRRRSLDKAEHSRYHSVFGDTEGHWGGGAMVHNISNHTSHSAVDPHYNFLALVFGFILIVCIICGNVLVCLSVCTEKALKTTTNYFIVSLAVADLLLAVLVLPLYVYTEFVGGVWTLSLVLCDVLMTMDVMLCTASIFNLCAISVDRFIAVSIPLNYNRRQVDNRQLFLISTTWIFAFAVASPVIFGLNNVADRDPTMCKLEDNNYIVYSSVCSFFIPCPIMLVLYCAMFHGLRKWEETRKTKLRSHMSPGLKPPQCPALLLDRSPTDSKLDELNLYDQGDCPFPKSYVDNGHGIQTVAYPHLKYSTNMEPERKQAKINGRERKAMRVLPVVVGAFLFCWTPFFVVHITRALCESCYIPEQLISIVTWLGYVNSALNPVIYTIFNTEFRNYFRKVLRVCC